MRKKKIKPCSSWLPLFSGFYDNWIYEPDFELEAENLADRGYKKGQQLMDALYDGFKWSEYHEAICKEMCNLVEDELSEWVEKIEYEKLSSPKEYNFYTDAIHCKITPKPEAIRKYIYDHKEAYEKYLLRYKSRDGFMSYFNHDFESWKDYTGDFLEFTSAEDSFTGRSGHHLGSVLEFIVENEGLEETDVWCYRGKERVYDSEFFDESSYEHLNNVAEFVRQNYEKPNLLNLLFEEFDTDRIDVEKIMYNTFKDIESHVLTIEFPEPKRKKK